MWIYAMGRSRRPALGGIGWIYVDLRFAAMAGRHLLGGSFSYSPALQIRSDKLFDERLAREARGLQWEPDEAA